MKAQKYSVTFKWLQAHCHHRNWSWDGWRCEIASWNSDCGDCTESNCPLLPPQESRGANPMTEQKKSMVEKLTVEQKEEILAKRVMGWCYHKPIRPALIKGVSSRCPVCNELVCNMDTICWHPYASDADCMAVWDRFSQDCLKNGMETWLAHEPTGWVAYVFEHIATSIDVENKDRRTAMCDCVVKAVMEGGGE